MIEYPKRVPRSAVYRKAAFDGNIVIFTPDEGVQYQVNGTTALDIIAIP
jgi:hypothetical protein